MSSFIWPPAVTQTQPCSLAALLPPEILSLIFNHLTQTELILAGNVSARWRAVSRDHPTFWRYIFVRDSTPVSLSLYTARMQPPRRGTSVKITLTKDDAVTHNALRQAVLPLLGTNLACLRQLRIGVDCSAAADTLRALSHVAPRMEHIGVMFCNVGGRANIPRLPAKFLGGDAPRLRFIELTDVRVPHRLTPLAAFAHVFKASFVLTTDQPFPPLDAARHLPRVKLLTYHVDANVTVDATIRLTVPASCQEFSARFRHQSNLDAVFSAIPSQSISRTRDIWVERPSVFTANLLLSHLRDEIELIIFDFFHNGKYLVMIAFTSPPTLPRIDTGMTRAFDQSRDGFHRDTPLAAYFGPHVASRLVQITIPCWHLLRIIRRLPELPALRELCIWFANGDELVRRTTQSQLIRAPGLSMLSAVFTLEKGKINSVDLVRFVGPLFGESGERVKQVDLKLTNAVTDKDLLTTTFKSLNQTV
ncbi:hypothetical protein BKA62DRAFT_663495 [Auriculariales sp. MPI-PUGE-AT-0066]|nr:hypothetical protein BKA62DRAFT_663495 [Auriculariales sp. MPI-PUGE-AT-0066]